MSHGPAQPRSCLAGLAPSGPTRDQHWDEFCRAMLGRGIAIFRIDDSRMTWVEREQVRQAAQRMYQGVGWRERSGR